MTHHARPVEAGNGPVATALPRRRAVLAVIAAAALSGSFALQAIANPIANPYANLPMYKEQGGPKDYSLRVTGSTKDGATVTTTLIHAAHLGLFVQISVSIGLVPIGAQTPGHPQVHWNLKVDNKPLPPGKYFVLEEILTNQNAPSGVTASRDWALLTISRQGHDSVRMLRAKYPTF